MSSKPDVKNNAASPPITAAAPAAAGVGAGASAGAAAGAGADAKAVDRKERLAMGIFDNDYKTAPGFHIHKSSNINSNLRDLLKRPVALKLGRPAVSGRHVVVGSDDPDGKEHFLVVVDTQKLENNPIVSYLQIKEHVRDSCWLRNGKVLVAVGDGLVQLYSVDQNYTLTCTVDGATDVIHTDSVRELVAAPFDGPHAVSCGFDKALCQLDITRATQRMVRRCQLPEVVGSARWTAFKGASTVTCTTDDGKFYLFDFSSNATTAALAFNTMKPDMFAHEHYADHYVLLGYADGEIRNYDLRATNKPLSVTVDPYVDCIGNIHYREAADPNNNSFVVTGMTDFSVWTAREGQPQKLWSHQSAGPNPWTNTTNFTTTGAYIDDTRVVVANSNGFVECFTQMFQSDRPT